MARSRVAVALLGLLVGVLAAWTMLDNGVRPAHGNDVALVLFAGWTFLGTGLVAWHLRPDASIGPALVATGLLRFGEGAFWSQDPVVFTLGHTLSYLYMAGIVYVVLAFPAGRLETTLQRGLFATAAVATGPLQVAWLVTGGHEQSGSCAACPRNLLEITRAPELAATFQLAQLAVGAVVGALVIAVLVRRWRSASAALRFAISPVVGASAAISAALVTMVVNHLLGEPLGAVPHVWLDLTLALMGFAFLAGVARTRLARAGIADLLAELAGAPGAGDLRAALARSLRDPSLEIAFWLPSASRYVDASGRDVALPGAEAGREVTMINRHGRRIAALIHDPAVAADESLVQAVAAAAGLQLENERLQADLRAQLEEVRASRARIVEAAQEERRRIERNLHDGTQQRLVAVSMTLGLAEARATTDPAAAGALVGEAKEELGAALQELRELSQGIHPGVLTERGLAKAVDELALRMHVPVAVDVSLPERLPTPVETAAYYVISEALANVAKHAHARRARVGVARRDGHAVIAVSDDGHGGADMARGSGLRGLRDRVEALGGRLNLDSGESGTLVTAEIPCE